MVHVTRNKRTIIFILTLQFVIIGVPGVLLWRDYQQQRLNRRLFDAINLDDAPSALLALAHGADANARDEPVVPPWLLVWNLLRNRQAAVPWAGTPLLMSLDLERGEPSHANSRLQLFKALIAHGARVNVPNPIGNPPIWYALATCDADVARILIEHGSNLRDRPDVADLFNFGDILTFAIKNRNHVSVLEAMLQHGVDPNRVDVAGRTPLSTAVYYHDIAAVRCLLKHHADPNIRIHDPYFDGLQPLQYADQLRAYAEWRERRMFAEMVEILRHAGATEPSKSRRTNRE